MSAPTKLRVQKATVWSQLSKALANEPELIAIVLFCAIGLLITLNVMFRFPDFGAIIAEFNQF